MKFLNWIEIKESSLRDILSVEQDPEHHPEGNVAHHVYMVVNSMKKAINDLKEEQIKNPNGPLSNLDLNLNEKEKKVLKISAWLHDIGKRDTFAYNKKGKISAHGHDDPKVFEKSMLDLGVVWKKMYQESDPESVELVRFLISNHMKVQSQRLAAQLMENGKYKNETKVRLLLVLWMMDKIGRGGDSGFSRKERLDFIGQNDDASRIAIDRINSLKPKEIKVQQKTTMYDFQPTDFAKMLKSKNLSYNIIKNSLERKFKRHFSDEEVQGLLGEGFLSFKRYFEVSENEGHAIDADIPLDQEIYVLSNAFERYGKKLYVVGGAVRDYLFHIMHPTSKKEYKPKDVDIATEATPDEIKNILEKSGIKMVPKGESFGVISAIFGKKEFEIASFRSEWYDPESGDGRRPDKVTTGVSAKADASRRDLTMNALFYDIQNKKIIDFNLNHQGKGQGLEDIKNKVARPVGNAKERFREDKLRIPRLIRFFSRFNSSEIQNHLDQDTISAIEEFKDLAGVSPERVRAEFEAGLQKAISVSMYLKNYEHFNLLSNVVLPGLNLDLSVLDNLDNTKDIVVVLSTLLKNNPSNLVKIKLNELKYTNEITNAVGYLIDLYHFAFETTHSPENIRNTVEIIKNKNKLNPMQIKNFAAINNLNLNNIEKLLNYQLPKINSMELMNKGFKDVALGDEIRRQQFANFHNLD